MIVDKLNRCTAEYFHHHPHTYSHWHRWWTDKNVSGKNQQPPTTSRKKEGTHAKWNIWIGQLTTNTHLSATLHTSVIHQNKNNSISHFEMVNPNQIRALFHKIYTIMLTIISFQSIFQMQNTKSVHLIRVMVSVNSVKNVIRCYKMNGFDWMVELNDAYQWYQW